MRRAFRARVRGAHPDAGGDPERRPGSLLGWTAKVCKRIAFWVRFGPLFGSYFWGAGKAERLLRSMLFEWVATGEKKVLISSLVVGIVCRAFNSEGVLQH